MLAAVILDVVILDVDGVLLASPHERTWREALKGFAELVGRSVRLCRHLPAGRRNRFRSTVAGELQEPRISGPVARPPAQVSD